MTSQEICIDGMPRHVEIDAGLPVRAARRTMTA
jgi:hypothetical protein